MACFAWKCPHWYRRSMRSPRFQATPRGNCFIKMSWFWGWAGEIFIWIYMIYFAENFGQDDQPFFLLLKLSLEIAWHPQWWSPITFIVLWGKIIIRSCKEARRDQSDEAKKNETTEKMRNISTERATPRVWAFLLFWWFLCLRCFLIGHANCYFDKRKKNK